MKRRILDRRTFLRGAGTVAIGLPFLSEMSTTSSFAQPDAPPVRAFNCSFGLGLFSDMQPDDLSGPLEAFQSLRDKLLVLHGINFKLGNYDEANTAFGGRIPNSHLETTCFTGTVVQDDLNRAGGASLDQALRRHAYPGGLPAGMLSTVQAGLTYEIGHNARDIRSWNPDGSPASSFIYRANALFESLFGTFTPPTGEGGPTDAEIRACRRRNSILDAVVDQYQHYSSDRSPLGASSRAKLTLHLERIREVERRIFAADCEEPAMPMPRVCDVPGAPGSGHLDAEGEEYVDLTVTQLEDSWRTMVDTYALGVQCDQFRFGSMVFMAQGARIRLSGDYRYGGRSIYNFNDIGDWSRINSGATNQTSHEFWHAYGGGNSMVRAAANAHAHFMIRQCAYFAEALDNPEYTDDNGKTIFENSMVTFGTEAGSGDHGRSAANRVELANVFHAISPADGRFRTGRLALGETDAVNLYNTMLQAYDVGTLLGDGRAGVDAILG